jgi:hypothetical protein
VDVQSLWQERERLANTLIIAESRLISHQAAVDQENARLATLRARMAEVESQLGS